MVLLNQQRSNVILRVASYHSGCLAMGQEIWVPDPKVMARDPMMIMMSHGQKRSLLVSIHHHSHYSHIDVLYIHHYRAYIINITIDHTS